MIYIGDILKSRMNLLSIDIEELADRTFLDISDIKRIIKNEVSFDDIDFYDLTMVSNVLHCTPEYFASEECRKKDLLVGAQNRGSDNDKSKKVKLSIQDYLNDFSFLESII